MNFWFTHRNVFPNLFKQANKYLGFIASSASSERLFSDASNYYKSRRTRMLYSTLENECIIHSYVKTDGVESLMNGQGVDMNNTSDIISIIESSNQ